MVKSELIIKIANKQDSLSVKDVELSVNHILESMSESLGSGDRIEIRGFGSFCLHYRPPRKAHNPKTGARVFTAANAVFAGCRLAAVQRRNIYTVGGRVCDCAERLVQVHT